MCSDDAAQPPLSPVQQRVVASLRRDGLAIVSFADLIGDESLWARLAEDVGGFGAIVEQRIREHGDTLRTKAKKADFIIRASVIQGSSPPKVFLRYALSDQLLGISNAYLALRSKLIYVDKWYTVPVGGNAERVKSQRWHRDHVDAHIVKIFTYFSDVDADAGALEYVRGSAPGGPYGDLWASSRADHYPPDGELEHVIPSSACVRAEGAAGMIVLCDTAGFHRGGFGRRPRITANFTYVSPAALTASRAERRFAVDAEIGSELSPAARFALA